MIKIRIMLIFVIAYNFGYAQHIQYRDRKNLPSKPVSAMAEDSVREIITPHSECPGMKGSLPVVTNYVPPEIVKKFKIKFAGHVYSITSLKVSANQLQYKLKVCNNGEFVIRFVDTDGDIVR